MNLSMLSIHNFSLPSTVLLQVSNLVYFAASKTNNIDAPAALSIYFFITLSLKSKTFYLDKSIDTNIYSFLKER